MRARLLVPLVVALCATACGAGVGVAGTVHTKPATQYLLSIDQLASPGFGVYQAPRPLSAGQAPGAHVAAARLATDGALDAASVEFFRATTLALANGPVDVIDSVERFASIDGATDVFDAAVAGNDAQPGAAPLSTGPLGDAAHADQLVRSASGVRAAQFTVIWRVGNLLTVLQVRGRDGGTRLADALLLAQRQTQAQIRSG